MIGNLQLNAQRRLQDIIYTNLLSPDSQAKEPLDEQSTVNQLLLFSHGPATLRDKVLGSRNENSFFDQKV